MNELEDQSVDLVVTSPPYPMVAMWDEIFSQTSHDVGAALSALDGNAAFELMHRSLDTIWTECSRVMKPGAFACINIGDATRKLGERFRLYPNHTRIVQKMTALGFDCLPMIHWFKPTNSPTKFMGSGMHPSGAYVTLEHEYILIFRKGGKRKFTPAEQQLRRRSAFFWEERNSWFSDVWDFKGTSQLMAAGAAGKNAAGRDRSGAYPFELPYRLINMYSMQQDTVLDPFMGTGTSLAAALLNGRACVGYEIDEGLSESIQQNAKVVLNASAEINDKRLKKHNDFITEYTDRKGVPKYLSGIYGFPVVTRQETNIEILQLKDIAFKEAARKNISLQAEYL